MYMFGQIFKQRALEVKRSIGQMPRLPRACFIATPPLVLVKMVILVEETDKIMKAQIARGADFESGNIWNLKAHYLIISKLN